MNLDLPAPDPRRLERSPLELVVCQIRFDNKAAAEEPAVALSFHAQLGGEDGRYPNMEPIAGHEYSITMGPNAAPATETKTLAGWRLSSAEDGWVISLTAEYVAIETSAYQTWDDFRERLAELIAATAAQLAPAIEQRIGLRYVDRIGELELSEPQQWAQYIAPELLGPILHPKIGPTVKVAQQALALELGDGIACGLRHGVNSEQGSVDYLLDFDLSRQGGRAFEPEALLATADRLNEYGLQLFQAAITPELYERLAPT